MDALKVTSIDTLPSSPPGTFVITMPWTWRIVGRRGCPPDCNLLYADAGDVQVNSLSAVAVTVTGLTGYLLSMSLLQITFTFRWAAVFVVASERVMPKSSPLRGSDLLRPITRGGGQEQMLSNFSVISHETRC
jgi:hypothetical protein